MLAGSSGWQTDEADSFLEFGVSVELQEGDVVVEGLRVVVVVDVRRGDPKGLGAGGAKLLGEVVVAHTDIDGVTSANNAAKGRIS